MKAVAVIGANYGDEGKGLVTDFLASHERSLVVRFNGGAQAGHTVVTPDGRRHVFSHFGAGTFAGAATFLTGFFIVNPVLFRKERQKLAVDPVVFVDPDCKVTTPWDMMLNQMRERARGDQRHGSCGVGIYETLKRHDYHRLNYRDLIHPEKVRKSIDWIKTNGKMLAASFWGDKLHEQWDDSRVVERFLEDCQFMLDHTRCRMWDEVDKLQPTGIVFEGAQGLGLDQHALNNYPYLTPSNTGLKNVELLCYVAGIPEVEVFYVTRTYLTRHGAGPLAYEMVSKPYRKVVDETNVKNEFQGKLRWAAYDLASTCDRITRDLGPSTRSHPKSVKVTPALAITCVDQLDHDKLIQFGESGKVGLMPFELFKRSLKSFIGTQRVLLGYGPTRKDVHWEE